MIPEEPLASLCEFVTDGTHYTPPEALTGIPFLTVKDMNGAGLDFDGCAKISAEEFEAARAQNSAPQKGDVLFSKDGTVGKVHVVHEQRKFAVLSSIAIMRPKKGRLDASYLGHFLRSPRALAEAAQKRTGSALRRIVLSDLKQISVPTPEINEQRRIAAILDQADAIRRKRRQALADTKALLRAAYLQLVGLKHPDHNIWPVFASRSWRRSIGTRCVQVPSEVTCSIASSSTTGSLCLASTMPFKTASPGTSDGSSHRRSTEAPALSCFPGGRNCHDHGNDRTIGRRSGRHSRSNHDQAPSYHYARQNTRASCIPIIRYSFRSIDHPADRKG